MRCTQVGVAPSFKPRVVDQQLFDDKRAGRMRLRLSQLDFNPPHRPDSTCGGTQSKPFSFFRPEFVSLNGSPFIGQYTEAKGGTTEVGREREDSTERNPDGNAGARFVYL